MTDGSQLQRLAQVFAEGGWAPTVADGGFIHEYSAQRRPALVRL